MDEQNVEAKLGDDSRCGCIAIAKAGLSIVLAYLRRSFEFDWIGISNLGPVLIAGYSGFSGGCCWSVGAPGESSARLPAFFAWSVCRSGVLLGKFWWESNLVMYASLGLLVMASVWNAWPHRAAVSDCCAEKSIN